MAWQLARARIFRNRLNFAIRTMGAALALLTIMTIQSIAISSSHSQASFSLAKLPRGDQAITLASSHAIFSVDERAKISRSIKIGLAGLASSDIREQVLFHELSDLHGTGFYFGGLEALTVKTKLISGRFPRSCNANFCEVIQIVNRSPALPYLGNLNLLVVGQANLSDSLVFSGTYSLEPNRSLFLTDGVEAALNQGSAFGLQGSNGWVGEINIADVGRNGVQKYIDAILRFENGLALDFSGISLTWPVDALANADSDSSAVSKKIGALNQVVTALFLSFLFLFAQRQKKGDKEFRSGMSRIGAPKLLILRAIALENAAPFIFGALLGLAISPLIRPILSLLGFEVTFQQIYSNSASQIFLFLLAIFLTVAATLQGDFNWRRESRWLTLCTVLTFGALVLLNSTVFGAENLSGWLLPIVVVIVATKLAYLFFDRVSLRWRRDNLGKFLIARENLENWQPLTAILTLALLLAISSLSYASGVDRKIATSVSARTPLDFRLTTGSALQRPLDIAGIFEYANLAKNSFAYPVLRVGSSLPGLSEVSDSIAILGVPPEALTHLRERGLQRLGGGLKPLGQSAEIGISMADAKVLTVDLKNIPKVIDLIAWFRTPQDQHRSLTSIDHGEIRKISLTNNLPAGSLLVAMELRETSQYISRRLHALGEGKFAVPLIKGIGSIISLDLDGKRERFASEAWGFNNFSYSFDGGSQLLRPFNKIMLPQVIADPITASRSDKGYLTLSTSIGDSFKVKIASVQKSFPSAGERFVVMDLSMLRAQVSRTQIGASDPIELWIATSKVEQYRAAIAKPKYAALQILSRQKIANELRVDPVNQGLKYTYLIGLFFALCLALIMHLSAIPLIFRERLSLLRYIEIQGSPPTEIKAALWVNARATVLVASATALLIGIPLNFGLISGSIPLLRICELLLVAIFVTEVVARLANSRHDL